jgi:hypothetical protein
VFHKQYDSSSKASASAHQRKASLPCRLCHRSRSWGFVGAFLTRLPGCGSFCVPDRQGPPGKAGGVRLAIPQQRTLVAPSAPLRPFVKGLPMSTIHPVDGGALLTVREAAAFLTAHGLPTSVASLNSDRSNGTGPKFLKIEKIVYYRQLTLESHVLSKLTDEVQSTSELRVSKQLQIENKSEARP